MNERPLPTSPLDDLEDAPFEPLTREQAQALRDCQPPLSPWRLVTIQAVAGAVCAAVAWAVTQRIGIAGSALYGAACCVLPSAVLARGMTRRTSSNLGAAVAGFMFWEMLKMGLAVALLAMAPRVVHDLSWPALLVGLVVCMKVNWLVLLMQRQSVAKDL